MGVTTEFHAARVVESAMPLTLGRTAPFANGEAHVEEAAPKIIVSVVTGYIDVAMMRHLLEQFEAWRARNGEGLVSFHDLEGVTDYDPEARRLLAAWVQRHRPQFRVAHILVRSQALAWGIRLLSTLTDRLIVAHSDRASFDLARPASIKARCSLGG